MTAGLCDLLRHIPPPARLQLVQLLLELNETLPRQIHCLSLSTLRHASFSVPFDQKE
jgi:hypothetical protein